MDMRKRFGVLNEREFRRLYLARAFSLFGDGLVPVALSFAVLSIDPSPSGLGYVLSSRFVSRIGFLLIAGVVADRLPRKHVMIGSDLARLLAEGIAATLLITGTAEVWQLACLFFIYGAGEAFFLPTSTAIVPQTVSPSGLQQANALLAFTTSGFVVLGPIVAGVLVVTVGAGWALAIDASTFFFSALFLSRLRVVGFPGRKPHAFLHELREGWREFCSRTWLWVDGVFSALGSFAVLAPFLALGPVVAQRSLGGAPAWASIITAFGLGSVLGGVLLLRIRPRRPLLVAIPPLALLALPTGLLAVPAPTVAIALAAFAGGLGLSVFNTLFETTVQQHVPADALSRVASIDWMLSGTLMPLGLAVAGPVASAFGVRVPLAAGAIWIVASTAVVLAIPSVRNVRQRGETLQA